MNAPISSCVGCSLLQWAGRQTRQQSRQASSCLSQLLNSCDEKLRRMRRDATYNRGDELNPGVKAPYVMLAHFPRKLLSFSSTDYLGLSSNPHVLMAFNRGVVENDYKRHGTYRHDVRELEASLARFHQREDCLAFTSLEEGIRFVLATMFTADDVIFCDEYNSLASQTGVAISGAKEMPYKHCDIDDLQRKLKAVKTKGVKVVLTEGYFSRTGDSVNLRKLMAVAEENNALVILEDSHSIGMLGHSNRGLEDTLSDGVRPFLTLGSLENAFGQHSGGYAVGPPRILDAIYELSMHSEENIPPGVVAAAQEIVTNVKALKEPAEQVRKRSFELKQALQVRGWMPTVDEHPAMSVMVGNERAADTIVDNLIDLGICVGALKYPVVPKGAARLNFFLTRLHTEDHVSRMLDAVTRVGRRLKLPNYQEVKHLF